MPLIARAQSFASRQALLCAGREISYADLLHRSHALASRMLWALELADLEEKAVATMVSADDRSIVAQWAAFRAGGMWTPIALSYPAAEIERVLDDSQPCCVLVDEAHLALMRPLCEQRGHLLVVVDAATGFQSEGVPGEGDPKLPKPELAPLPEVALQRAAMMLFTSGTTSRPKGVVTTHANLNQQLQVLCDAWSWSSADRAILFLPLHHVHGLVNVLGCGLFAGARVQLLSRFDAEIVCQAISRGEVSVLMAVPTVYHRLVQFLDAGDDDARQDFHAACGRVRLMVSGSAALPVPLLERWRELSGHTLLERYGMTEIGMALSNPYAGERVAGSVGFPLPTVQVRVREEGELLAPGADGDGELEVRGPSVFREYFSREEATAEAFTDDGWFKTGDRVRREAGRYSILGRNSLDILKTGGFKVSALEIESVLLGHGDIRACAVVGLPHDDWGEEVWAALELEDSAVLDEAALSAWAKERLAPYKVPRRWTVAELPRNAMGKLVKPTLIDALVKARAE